MNYSTTEYVLIMDDDWVLTNISRFEDAFTLLENNSYIDIVTGFLCGTVTLQSCYGYQGKGGTSLCVAWMSCCSVINSLSGSLSIMNGILTYKDKEIRY